jgi:histidine triad (HIT) family protein
MDANENCPFCKIARREIPAREEYRDDEVVAFHDLNPQAPVHVLVIPVRHADHLSGFPAGPNAAAGLARLLETAAAIGTRLGPEGYRVVINEGPAAGQTVHHLHLHVLAGRRMTWPPG